MTDDFDEDEEAEERRFDERAERLESGVPSCISGFAVTQINEDELPHPFAGGTMPANSLFVLRSNTIQRC